MPDGSMPAEAARGAAAADRGGRSERDQRVQRRGGFRRSAGVVRRACAPSGGKGKEVRRFSEPRLNRRV